MAVLGWLNRWGNFRKTVLMALLGMFCFGGFSIAAVTANDSSEVLQGFTEKQDERHGVKEIADQRKHQILFYMGIALLIGILTTAGLGIAMALYGKEVFLAHMLSAGFSVFLAVAHAVTAVVWFFPF